MAACRVWMRGEDAVRGCMQSYGLNALDAVHSALARLLPWLPDSLRVPAVVVAALALVAGFCVLTLRPVFDPDRALIFRLATLHRVAGPGYVFVIPWLERIESELDMGEHETRVRFTDAHSSDGVPLAASLEVTWRIHPGVRGRLPSQLRATVLMAEERRAKLVDEVITRAARRVLADYSRTDLAHTGARDGAAQTIAHVANDELVLRGLWVDRVFWRAWVPAELSPLTVA
jgi:hypothetical protein